MTHKQENNWRKCVMSLKCTRHTKHTVVDLFNAEATKQRLNYSEQESKEQFAVYDSHILVTLK